jgi:hypothetical protein
MNNIHSQIFILKPFKGEHLDEMDKKFDKKHSKGANVSM